MDDGLSRVELAHVVTKALPKPEIHNGIKKTLHDCIILGYMAKSFQGSKIITGHSNY